MRITEVIATPVAVPYVRPERWAYGVRRGLVSVLLEVRTDEGLTGIGEAPAYPSAEIVTSVVHSLLPLVHGEDPMAVERLMARIDIVGTWHHVQATSPAIAGVEMACWDIVGKVCGQPVSALLGGLVRERAETICYLGMDTPETMRGLAAEAAAGGFATMYFKVGADEPGLDVERVAAVRDGAGPQARLRVDANESWSAAHTIAMDRRLAPYRLEFLEQPVSGRNLAEMAYVRSRTTAPILANEASWTRQDQLAVVTAGAADAVSVDNQMDGGLLNLKRGAGVCDAAGIPVVKHSLGELGVATAAALHVICSTPNFLYANQAYTSLLADDVLAGDPLDPRDGTLAVPTGPGLGVELDPDKVARYAELHRREGESFSFGDAGGPTPLLPKR
ncbi:MAG: mandelate racemase/muconate lactonizing enzyme family protein [Marmoricola sp.]